MPWPLGLLVFVDFREFGVDHFFVTRRSFGGRLGRLGSLLAARRLRFLVDRLAELHGGLSQSFGLGLHRLGIAAFDGGLGLGHGGLDLALERFVDLVAMLFQLLLGRMDQAFGLVLRFSRLAPLLVLVGELLGVFDHLFDVGVAEAARSLDADLLLLASTLV